MSDSAVLKHPCYSEQAHHHFARMHAAVAPKCNIRCNYCNPKFDCVNESRPGVVSQVLSPEEAAEQVARTMSRLPQLSVIGIAGPGDPLANADAVFRTFRLVSELDPNLHLCLSTNGLMLPDYVGQIAELGIRHVTVTMNAVDPAIGARVYEKVFYDGVLYSGEEAARLLINRQLQGIEMLAKAGVLCKVNSVHIPEVNGEHLAEVTRTVKELGAFSHNIMPLILSPGSFYARQDYRVPTGEESAAVQRISSEIMPVMRHCRQCRADAVGMLGDDLSQEPDRMQDAVLFDKAGRAAHQEMLVARMNKSVEPAEGSWDGAVRVAVATRGSGEINQHFGHAREFLVYEARESGDYRLVGVRKVQAYCNGLANCGEEDENSGVRIFAETVNMLKDCVMLLCSGIGKAPASKLKHFGIMPIVCKGDIDSQLRKNVRFYHYFAEGCH
ncbi:nitrogenase cofactor biosynthesis protein NifB [Paenibacillus sp. HN-1]|uniref:nitrogenase cofactor biosynthesis protein NifB n=1 Tax=Paenibacillus TaxID=44249 RepID=UPI001CA8B13F|nr:MULTISPECIES: nitrogenase cofactor biosynthesis protein NifB [Paenibacillus]MBY9079756.1 nitrogenase cofactor biosynthesis protein NifB [Paenibacillus sp. CGMCC 1.18879]MBY9084400.1 nitrogenase cofactor biosynthesis protein NifB [Paenibacillus sinensis]